MNFLSNYLGGPGGAVKRALVAYEVWGSTPLFVCSWSLGEPLPPGTGISLGEAWDTLVHPKKKTSCQTLSDLSNPWSPGQYCRLILADASFYLNKNYILSLIAGKALKSLKKS
jgi:hypothetical protein